MSPDEITAKLRELEEKEKKLQTLADELRTRAASLDQLTAAATADHGKSLLPAEPTTTSLPNSIKLHVPITLDLNSGNYTSWRELFLIALGR